MNNCSFCHIQTQQDICPQCCAPISGSHCNYINTLTEISKDKNYYQTFNNLIPIFTTCILKLYQGPAWLISIFLGTIHALNIKLHTSPYIINKRSFYYVEKLFSTNLLEPIFITPEDFISFKNTIQEISSKLNYHQKHRIDFLEIWKILKIEGLEKKIKQEIEVTHVIQNWPAFFELLGTQIGIIWSVHINNNFLDHHDSFKDVYFHGTNSSNLHIQNSNANYFDSSLWTIQQKIYLENFPYLEHLPECEDTTLTYININFTQCALTHLPSTITKRCIENIELSGCKTLTKLPLTLKPLFEKGQIKTLNLTDTGVPQEYRKKFTEKILDFPNSMFSNMSVFNLDNIEHPLRSNKNIKNAINLLIPVSLIGLTIQKILQPKNKNIITEKISFWGAFMTIALGTIATTSQLKKLQYQNAIHIGSNIDAIWLMLNKTGIQKEGPEIGINWDHVWESIFPSIKNWCGTPPLTCFKPELNFVKNFLKSWIDARENTQEQTCKDAMTRNIYQFIQENGGQNWAKQISQLPLYKMIYTIEQRSFNYPEIKKYIDGYQKSIGNYEIDRNSIELNLDDILYGCAYRPSVNFDGIFSLIKSGKNICLKLDWSYQGIKQALHFHPSSEIHTLDIHNAIIHNISDDYWLVKHKLSFTDCDGITQLPKIPKITPRSPLTLELHGLIIERLPDDICNRSFGKISLINCPNFYFLPEEWKESIKQGVLKHIIVKNSGLTTKKEEYINDTSILEEPIFECCPELPPIKIIEHKSWWSMLDTMKFSLIESGISFLFGSIIIPKISKKHN